MKLIEVISFLRRVPGNNAIEGGWALHSWDILPLSNGRSVVFYEYQLTTPLDMLAVADEIAAKIVSGDIETPDADPAKMDCYLKRKGQSPELLSASMLEVICGVGPAYERVVRLAAQKAKAKKSGDAASPLIGKYVLLTSGRWQAIASITPTGYGLRKSDHYDLSRTERHKVRGVLRPGLSIAVAQEQWEVLRKAQAQEVNEMYARHRKATDLLCSELTVHPMNIAE